MLGLIWVQKSLVFHGYPHLKSVTRCPLSALPFGCLQPFLLAAGRLHYLGVQPFVHWERGILEVVAVDAVLADALDADTGLAVVQQQAVANLIVGAQLPQQDVDSFRLLRCDFDDH